MRAAAPVAFLRRISDRQIIVIVVSIFTLALGVGFGVVLWVIANSSLIPKAPVSYANITGNMARTDMVWRLPPHKDESTPIMRLLAIPSVHNRDTTEETSHGALTFDSSTCLTP